MTDNRYFVRDDITGHLLNIDELELHDIRKIAAEVFENIRSYEGDMYKQYLSVLTKYNIMCPHPQHKRLYNGKKLKHISDSHQWYECEMCDCSVMNESFRKE